MPSPAYLLLVASLLPLLSFGVLLVAGRRLGNPIAGWFGTLAISASFILTLLAMFSWLRGGNMLVASPQGPISVKWGYHSNFEKGPIDLPVKWLPAGLARGGQTDGDRSNWLEVGLYVDSLTIAMFAMITLVAALVHWFSVGYMHDDPRFSRYFAWLGLFSFSMLGLVISGALLQLFIFWELVGFCSYMLIGFWYEKNVASNAALKAFITNRIGDVGFLIGFGLLFYYLGNASFPKIWLSLSRAGLAGTNWGGPVVLGDGTIIAPATLTVIGICLFCGAIGKSAQFPLHVWLPDAMEGPTPVSALIHAATMVAAGVYMLGRIFPILTPGAKLFIAIIGLTTLTMAALIAMAQSDIKRVLAFSTISQLGYMVLAMGVGSWEGGLFHLLTHAFFKALLFLGAGSVILASGHEQEMRRFGGLWRKLPITAATFGIAVLTISGLPQLSGHYSKDMILRHAGAFAALSTGNGHSSWYWAFFFIPMAIAGLTAFYMTRCWMLTFWGKPRNFKSFEAARESPVLWGPLMILAVLSIVAGNWLSIPELLHSSMRESQVICRRLSSLDTTGMYRGQNFIGFATAWPGPQPNDAPPPGEKIQTDAPTGEPETVMPADLTESQRAHNFGERVVSVWGIVLPLLGIAMGILVYWNGYSLTDRLMRIPPVAWIHRWLYHRMYFDELYFALFVALTLGISFILAWFDRVVIDGVVNVTGWLVKQCAFGAGKGDLYFVDGAVNGAGRIAMDLGAAARAPQTGRIRLYVTILALAVAIGAAVAIVVVVAR